MTTTRNLSRQDLVAVLARSGMRVARPHYESHHVLRAVLQTGRVVPLNGERDASYPALEVDVEDEPVAPADEGAPSPAGHVVCVVGLVTDPADTKVLLVKSPKRGKWELVGGKKKLDKTWQASRLDELAEEACMSGDLDPGPPMSVLEGLPVPGSPYASLILVGRIWSSETPAPGTETHAKILDARWFTRGEIPWDEVSEITSTQVLRRWAACGSAHGPELQWNDRKNAPECVRCGAAVTLDDWDDYRASLETP